MTGNTHVKRRPLLAILMFTFAASLTLYQWRDLGVMSIYGVMAFSILGTKLFLSLLPAKRWPPLTGNGHSAGVVVTIYNEDPGFLVKCLDSLLAQTFPVSKIILIDDRSTNDASYETALAYQARYPDLFDVVRQEENLGKRHALARGFGLLDGVADVYVCVDSDTILEPNAISEGMRPFVDGGVTASTGVVIAANHESKLLTRLIDVRYINAFLGERAAYSVLGSVLCVCGSLAFYRASALMPNVERFLDQKFLGEAATIGDDRHLTNLCLLSGRVVMAENSIGHTAVPERFGHYLRQQARWGRSFFRESIWALKNQPIRRPAWWLTLLELTQWAVFSTLLVYALLVHPLVADQFVIDDYLVFVGLMAFARSVRYFDVVREHQSVHSQITSFLASPLYGYMNLLIMLPLRVFSLLTLKRTSWGTRSVIEVSVASAIPEPAFNLTSAT